jgi:hypothetical protein
MNAEEPSPYAHHDEIWLLLPWYANGTLDSAETERVKAHLRVCLSCRRELAGQAALARQVRHDPPVRISAQPSFERLAARIRQEETARPPRKARHWLASLGAGMPPARLAAACAAGLLALAIPFWPGGPPQPAYHTVADPGSLDRFAANDLRVMFAAQATRQDIDALLAAVRGRLVDGPSPAGLYTLRLDGPLDGPPDGLPQALGRLRGSPSVAFAEPALPPGAAR